MKKTLSISVLVLLLVSVGCDRQMTSNDIQRERSNKLLLEAVAQVGLPAIKNFREFKILKDIFELRDQEGLVTYTYLENQLSTVVPGATALGGKLTFLGESIGYGIPYATQFTAPETMQRYVIPGSDDIGRTYGVERLPQADPNALFPPTSADGTWVLMKDPNSGKVLPVFIEPRIVVSPFKFKFDK